MPSAAGLWTLVVAVAGLLHSATVAAQQTSCSLIFDEAAGDFKYVCVYNGPPTPAPTRSSNLEPSLTVIPDQEQGTDLDACQGHCDSDWDCDFGLSCYREEGAVPGCLGDQQEDIDYCYTPPQDHLVLWTDGTAGDKVLLDVCEGHCVTDLDCNLGLQCFDRAGTEPVPGCTGTGAHGVGYCFNPEGDYDEHGGCEHE